MYQHHYFVREGLHVNPRYIVEFVLHSKSVQGVSGGDDVSIASEASLAASLKDKTPVHAVKEGEAHHFFDPVMYRAVSLKEKQSNANLSRRLIPIEQAYTLAQDESLKEDSTLTNKLEWIDSKLSEVDTSVR